MPVDPQTKLPAGELIAGRYRYVRGLGEGSTGRVWLVEDTAASAASPTFRALKWVEATHADRVRSEFALLSRIAHPNLAAVHDLVRAGTQERGTRPVAAGWALVSDYVAGEPAQLAAAAWLGRRDGLLTFSLRVLEGVARALAELHGRGFVHGDIKPENVLVDRDASQVTVIDLGLARPAGVETTLSGTPRYMAPELFRGELTPAADVYALGLLVRQTLEPELAAAERTLQPGSLLARALQPMAAAPSWVPQPIAALLSRMYAIDRGARLSSGAELLDAISDLARVLPAELAQALSSPAKRSRKRAHPARAATPGALPLIGQAEALEQLTRALCDHKLIWVWGAPGSGRSRVIRDAVFALQLQRAEREQPIPTYRTVHELPARVEQDSCVLHVTDADATPLSEVQALSRATDLAGRTLWIILERTSPQPREPEPDATVLLRAGGASRQSLVRVDEVAEQRGGQMDAPSCEWRVPSIEVAALGESALAELLRVGLGLREVSDPQLAQAQRLSAGLAGRLCRELAAAFLEGAEVEDVLAIAAQMQGGDGAAVVAGRQDGSAAAMRGGGGSSGTSAGMQGAGAAVALPQAAREVGQLLALAGGSLPRSSLTLPDLLIAQGVQSLTTLGACTRTQGGRLVLRSDIRLQLYAAMSRAERTRQAQGIIDPQGDARAQAFLAHARGEHLDALRGLAALAEESLRTGDPAAVDALLTDAAPLWIPSLSGPQPSAARNPAEVSAASRLLVLQAEARRALGRYTQALRLLEACQDPAALLLRAEVLRLQGHSEPARNLAQALLVQRPSAATDAPQAQGPYEAPREPGPEQVEPRQMAAREDLRVQAAETAREGQKSQQTAALAALRVQEAETAAEPAREGQDPPRMSASQERTQGVESARDTEHERTEAPLMAASMATALALELQSGVVRESSGSRVEPQAEELRREGRYPRRMASSIDLSLQGLHEGSHEHSGVAPDAWVLVGGEVRRGACALLARLSLDGGDFEACREYARRATEGGRDDDAPALRAVEVLSLLELAEGRLDSALARAEAGAVLAQKRGARAAEARLCAVVGSVQRARGQLSAAARQFARAAELAAAQGELHAAVSFSVNLASAQLDAGELGPALRNLRKGASGLVRLGRERDTARVLANWLLAAQLLGDYEHALALAERLSETARRVDDPWALAFGLLSCAEMLIERGEHAAAEACLEQLPTLDALPPVERTTALARSASAWSSLALAERTHVQTHDWEAHVPRAERGEARPARTQALLGDAETRAAPSDREEAPRSRTQVQSHDAETHVPRAERGEAPRSRAPAQQRGADGRLGDGRGGRWVARARSLLGEAEGLLPGAQAALAEVWLARAALGRACGEGQVWFEAAERALSEARTRGEFPVLVQALGACAEAARALGNGELVHVRYSELRALLDSAALTLTAAERALLRNVRGYRAALAAAPARSPARAEVDVRFGQLTQYVKRLTAETRLPRLYERILDAAIALSGAERGLLLRPDAQGRVRARAQLGAAQSSLAAAVWSQSIVDRVLRSGQLLTSVDAAEDQQLMASSSVHALALRSVLALPMRTHDAVLGVIYLEDRLRPFAFGEPEIALLSDFADLASLTITGVERLRRERRAVRRLSLTQARLAAQVQTQAIELRALKQAHEPLSERTGIVAESPAMREVLSLALRVAPSDVPVLIRGESGTGKELVARAIHAHSARRDRPFVSESCGAIPETLLESALFGHVKGAFTGADRRRVGLFEAANGGTLFLDEIAEMSPAMQTRLLRVLQEGEVRPVGGERTLRVDVRVLAATHRDLDAMVADGSFREDLFYRLAVVDLRLPPLRERASDIVPLVQHFVQKHAAGRSPRLERRAIERLMTRAWPGNVRQLENEVRRALVLGGDVLREEHFALAQGKDSSSSSDLNLRAQVDELERKLIKRAFELAKGKQTRAAELLGVSRFGLQKMIKRLGITAT